jgi:DNA-binding transcriptional LysR family regulator
MELLQLKYFQTVARLEHMTKAAKELHVAQPSLSKTIARLEQDIGVPLFDRHKQKIRLNPYGQLFLKQVDAALELLEEGKRQVVDQAGLEHGRVFLATTNHRCDAQLIGSFLSAHPEVNLRLTHATSQDEKMKLLHEGELDFCITSLPIEATETEIEYIDFLTEEIFLAVPPTHHLTAKQSIYLTEVADETFISLPKNSSLRELTTQFCIAAGFEPKIGCEVDTLPVVSDFVKMGMGIAFVSDNAKKRDPSLTLISIKEPICRRTFQLAWKKNHYLSKAAHTFREYLIDFYKDLV